MSFCGCKACWAAQIACISYFNYADARMLLMIRAETTVVGASFIYLSTKLGRHHATSVEFIGVDIGIKIRADKAFKLSMVFTSLFHEYFVVFFENSGIYHLSAIRTYASCKFNKNPIPFIILI